MSKRLGEHLRSNVVGYVAIFLFAIGGTAYATHPGGANTIDSGDIINGQVTEPDIATNAVRSPEILNDSVAGGGLEQQDLQASSVGASEIRNNAVAGAEVEDDSLGSADLGGDSVGSSEVLDGSLGQSDLGTDSVGSDEIQTGAVHSDELAGTGFGNNGFNGDEEIVDGSITGFDIGASELGGGHIANGSLNGADIAGGLASGAAQNAAVVTIAGGAGTDVVTAAITNESTSQFIINGVAELQGAESDERALCRVLLDGSQLSLSYESTFDDIGTSNEATVAVNTLANAVAPGAHTVAMNCISLAGTIVKDDAGINAIAIP